MSHDHSTKTCRSCTASRAIPLRRHCWFATMTWLESVVFAKLFYHENSFQQTANSNRKKSQRALFFKDTSIKTIIENDLLYFVCPVRDWWLSARLYLSQLIDVRRQIWLPSFHSAEKSDVQISKVCSMESIRWSLLTFLPWHLIRKGTYDGANMGEPQKIWVEWCHVENYADCSQLLGLSWIVSKPCTLEGILHSRSCSTVKSVDKVDIVVVHTVTLKSLRCKYIHRMILKVSVPILPVRKRDSHLQPCSHLGPARWRWAYPAKLAKKRQLHMRL